MAKPAPFPFKSKGQLEKNMVPKTGGKSPKPKGPTQLGKGVPLKPKT